MTTPDSVCPCGRSLALGIARNKAFVNSQTVLIAQQTWEITVRSQRGPLRLPYGKGRFRQISGSIKAVKKPDGGGRET
jgi:hypothetical protein